MNKISVIIPVFNVDKFLDQCLNSIINQTFRNLEILVVDDGSTDGSKKIYEKYAAVDNRIKIIHQKNSGISIARNTGLKFASGQWVHFIDSDDYIDIDYYEKMINAIGNTEPDILAGCVISQNSNLYNIQYKSKCILSTPSEKFLQLNALKNCTVWRYIFSRKFLDKNRLKFVPKRIFEDMLFIPKAILLANYVITVPDANYHYVRNPNSLLNRPETEERKQQYALAEQHVTNFAQKHNLVHILHKSRNIQITTYKILFFKLFKTIFFKDANEKKYYLFGIRIMKAYIKTES